MTSDRKHLPGPDCWCTPTVDPNATPTRRQPTTVLQPRVAASFTLAGVWLLLLLTAGLVATSEDGKVALCVTLCLVNLAGIAAGVWAFRRDERGAMLAAMANVGAAMLSALGTWAVLS